MDHGDKISLAIPDRTCYGPYMNRRLELRLSDSDLAALDELCITEGRGRGNMLRALIARACTGSVRNPIVNPGPFEPPPDLARGESPPVPPTQLAIAERVYVLEEETVTADSAGGTRPVAGEVRGLVRAAQDAALEAGVKLLTADELEEQRRREENPFE